MIASEVGILEDMAVIVVDDVDLAMAWRSFLKK